MSASFSIESSSGTYDVVVGNGVVAETTGYGADAHILADEFFRPLFVASSSKPLFIEATEQAKSLDRMPEIIERLRSNGANRGTHLIVLGGGVLQDIATFVASVYMRGIPWSYYPTTVLAMVDSCIGGKASINVGPNKNLVGTFHPPKKILVDPALAETLPRDQFASGLIEAAKITFSRGHESFERHLACGPSTTMSTAALEALVVNSLLAKKHFIEIDEFDKKERLLLNFGHTFGHAIEGASHYGIPHGIAVGLGILCSLTFQRQRGIEPYGVAEFEDHLHTMVHALPDLRAQLKSIDLAEVLKRFASDKKHSTTHYTLILVSASGEVVLEKISRTPELEAGIQHAIQATIDSIVSSPI